VCDATKQRAVKPSKLDALYIILFCQNLFKLIALMLLIYVVIGHKTNTSVCVLHCVQKKRVTTSLVLIKT